MLKSLSGFAAISQVLAGTIPVDDPRDLLGRLYKEFDHFGGAEVRIQAADTDIVLSESNFDASIVPPLEELRSRIYNGGRLPETGAEPGEIFVALTDDPSIMRISWATMDQVVESPRVVLDDPCTPDGCSFPATTTTYTVPTNWWPIFNGSLHTALVTGLRPSQRVTYRVGSDSPCPANATASFSSAYSFTTAPPVSSPTTVAFMADQGTVMPLGFAVSEKLIAVQDKLGVDMVMVVGDLSYAGIDAGFPRLNFSSQDEFEWIWDLWQLQNQPIAATRPFMVGIGNHEQWYNWTSVTNRFHMPNGPVSGAVPPFWWSFNHGLVHYVMLCSEFDLDPSSPQGMWLAADLALASAPAQRALQPWVIATIHRPMYSSDKSWEDIRLTLEPLFLTYQVDLVLSGHMHSYERTHAVGYDGSTVVTPNKLASREQGQDVYVSPKMPIYVVQGNSGAGQAEKWERPAPAWSASRWANGKDSSPPRVLDEEDEHVGRSLRPHYNANYTDSFGFGYARFYNSTTMYYESVPITGDFSDKFWITRPVPVVSV